MIGRDKRRDLLFNLSPPSLDDTAAHEVLDVKEMNELGPPLFRPNCSDCNFCDGLREMDVAEEDERAPVKDSALSAAELFKSLSFLDRYLAIFILLAMIAGVLIGVYKKEAVQRAFNVASHYGPRGHGLHAVSLRISKFPQIYSDSVGPRCGNSATITPPELSGFGCQPQHDFSAEKYRCI
ncbi:unnamed protein product [Rhizoctonia solani]|uniref:Uncharacterized protein n=1 Tax=Rhizoctonia solani TaxID=456999 RepID=A0A8H2X3G8_9AGAM|nr:unnamed protein product [Rhizoctonia solani]